MLDTICSNCNHLVIPFFSNGLGASSSTICPYCKSKLFNNKRDFVETVTSIVRSQYRINGNYRPKNFNPISTTDSYIDLLLDCFEIYREMYCQYNFEEYISRAIDKFLFDTDPITRTSLIEASLLIHTKLMEQINSVKFLDYL